MAVFRVERTRDYTVMSNHHLKNTALTLKAKGLLSMILSLPDEWNYTISGGKLTGRLLKAAIAKYLAHRKDKRLQKSRAAPVVPHGKQTVTELVGQNQGVSNIEITDKNIKDFDRVARKYGVDYAIKKDRSVSPPKYLVFFKGRDADALTAAFSEYTSKKMQKSKRPSVLAKLSQFKEIVRAKVLDRAKTKDRGMEL